MNSRKIAAVLLAGTLALTACGKKDDAEPSSAGETSVSVVESSETEASVSESATSGSEVTFETTDTSVSETESEPTESVVIDYSAETWYSTNVPVTSISFENGTPATWNNQELQCYYPGTVISFSIKPATINDVLTFDVVCVDANHAVSASAFDITAANSDDFIVTNKAVTPDDTGKFSIEFTDNHNEEFLGMVYVVVRSADGTTNVVAQAAVGVPSLFT